MTTPLIIVVSGPGGVGKGTIVDAWSHVTHDCGSAARGPRAAKRPGERDDAYVYTTRQAFEERIQAEGFLEYTEFLGKLLRDPLSRT